MSEHSSYTSGSGLSCGDNEGPIDGWLAIRPRIPLPRQSNADGRPVWEPPIFDYTDLIGEEYDQKRKAVQEYTNDVAKTTDFLDADKKLSCSRCTTTGPAGTRRVPGI